jgi:hypothetical protein
MIDQIIIAACGIASVWCSQASTDGVRRWACVAGLLAQPAWLYSAVGAQQWGVASLVLVYTAGWLHGVRIYWWRRSA